MTSLTGSRGPTGSLGSIQGKPKAPSGYKSFQQFTPQQMDLFQQLFSQVSPDSSLSKLAGGDQSQFQQMEAPALRQFNELQGNLASRFSGMGSTGARRSSGFQNTSNAASSNFAEQLQSQRQGLQRQAIQDLMGMSNSLLQQQPYGLVKKQEKQGTGWGGIGGGILGGIGGAFFGNPIAGASLGYGIGSSFDKKGGGGMQGQGNYGSFGEYRNPFSRSNPSLGAGYDQEFRMNPASMGY